IATVTNCVFLGNVFGTGPALSAHFSSVTLINCLLAENVGTVWTGAIDFAEGTLRLKNCTVAHNRGAGASGGINLFGNATGIFENTIFWGNTRIRPTGQADQFELFSEATATVNYSLIQGWDGSLGGVGNFGADPLFVPGPAGDYYLSQTAAGQGVDSPAVDAGSDTAVNLSLDTMTTRSDEGSDIGIVDIGYHFPITGGKLMPGDFDRNGLIDLFDVSGFQNCFTGQGPTDVPPSCRIFDFVPDSAIDLNDFTALQLTLTGP
ncbi:MAG: hypothetical protein IID38_07495, partial [Planctomycetes bacterium]|nr:hypothetical protein [Planctomycetota bacterium]